MAKVHDLIFIDDNLSDIQALIESLPDNSQWFKIDGLLDGFHQIEDITKGYKDLNSIQIVSHGNAGSLSIGSTLLTNQNLSNYQNSLSSIGSSLSETGDFLIYGCNVAADENGQKLITGIAEYTLADVAASANLSGPTHLGGDNILEFSTGNITTSVIDVGSLNEVLWDDSTITSDIQDATLEALLKTQNNDSVFTFEEMRALLETAAQGGINSNEFADLKKAYQ